MRAAKDQPNKILFRVAYARTRPFYCRGCICLTLDERNYQRRSLPYGAGLVGRAEARPRASRRWARAENGVAEARIAKISTKVSIASACGTAIVSRQPHSRGCAELTSGASSPIPRSSVGPETQSRRPAHGAILEAGRPTSESALRSRVHFLSTVCVAGCRATRSGPRAALGSGPRSRPRLRCFRHFQTASPAYSTSSPARRAVGRRRRRGDARSAPRAARGGRRARRW